MVQKADKLPLDWLVHWENEAGSEPWLTQLKGGAIARDFTWAEAVGEARRVAAYLKAKGWEPGSRVAILSKNCAHWILADIAIWMAGYVSVPLYPTLPAESVRQILGHSDSKAIFVGKLDGWEQMRPGVPESVSCISFPSSPPNSYATWDDIVADTAPLLTWKPRLGGELCSIIYTSGTTGMPKGVMHSFDTFSRAAETFHRRVGFGREDRMLSYLPLSHIAERLGHELSSLWGGTRIFFNDSLETFSRDMQLARPTFFLSVPRLWLKLQQGVLQKIPQQELDRMLALPETASSVKLKVLVGIGLDACRFAIGGAAPMPPELLDWYKALGLEIVEVYGMTENCGMSHANLPGQTRPGFVGVPYPGVECRVAADSGEVQIKGHGNMLGYFNEPKLTCAAFTEDGWLKTGDCGEINATGELRLTGRIKDIFKTSKGKYVAPAPIEDKLVMHPAVEACCVVGENCPQPFGLLMLSENTLTCVTESGARRRLASSLEDHLSIINTALAPYERMDFLVVVGDQWSTANGFLTPTFKIKRDRIEKAYGRDYDNWSDLKQRVIFG
jgi:long-chain acyl-CoA synthetase